MTTTELDPPITSPEDALALADDLVGPAVRRSLWILLLDAARRPFRTLIPIDHLPERPGAGDCDGIAASFRSLADGMGASAVVLAWERPGGSGFTGRDGRWLPRLETAFAQAGLPVAAVLLSWDEGVRLADPAAETDLSDRS